MWGDPVCHLASAGGASVGLLLLITGIGGMSLLEFQASNHFVVMLPLPLLPLPLLLVLLVLLVLVLVLLILIFI